MRNSLDRPLDSASPRFTRRRGLRAVLTLGACGVVVPAVSGCNSVLGDVISSEEYKTAIPEALVNSGLRIERAYADTGIDGLTRYLTVGITMTGNDLTAEQLQQIFGLIARHNTLRADHLTLRVKSLEPEESIDLESLVEGYAPGAVKYSVNGKITVNLEDLERLATPTQN